MVCVPGTDVNVRLVATHTKQLRAIVRQRMAIHGMWNVHAQVVRQVVAGDSSWATLEEAQGH